MRTLRAWAVRLRGTVRRRQAEQDFFRQIRADIDLYIEDAVRGGRSPEEARRAAALRFGSFDAATEAWRERRGIPFFENLIRDVAYALRVIRRNRGWATVAVLSLALGIGASAAVFSAANDLLFRKLSVPEPDALVTLRWEGGKRVNDDFSLEYGFTNFQDYGFVRDGAAPGWFGEEFSFGRFRAGATGAYETFLRLRAQAETLEGLFAVAPGPMVNLIVDGHGDTASTQFVSGEFHSTLQVAPAAGRPILPADDQAGAPSVAVISHGYWQRRFGGSASIVGKQVRINAVAFTIVGVSGTALPNVISGSRETYDVSIPLSNQRAFQTGESPLDRPTNWWLVMMGRVKPGVKPAQVEADLGPAYQQATLDGAAALLGTLPPEDRKEAEAMSFAQRVPRLNVVSGARGAYDSMPMEEALLAALAILVGIVMLIVCSNLVNLSLAFTTGRRQEVSVRRAIGASRRRLVLQVLTEHIVVALMGGGASLAVTYVFQDLIRLHFSAVFDWSVVAFSFAVATAAGIVVGLLPAFHACRVPESMPANWGSSRRSRFATGLLVTQVAMSVVLLVGAGLFLRSLANIQSVDPGFDLDRLVVFTIEPGFSQYDDVKTEALYKEIETGIRALPGVSSVTFSSQPLLANSGSNSGLLADWAVEGTPATMASRLVVQEDFFEALGIAVRQGRDFGSQDSASSPPVAVVNESLARILFGGENAIGRRFGDNSGNPKEFEIVGVVADTRHMSLHGAPPPTFYRPHLQSPGGARSFVVRTAQAPESLMPSIRQTVHAIDPALPILGFSTQDSAVETQWGVERTIALASGALGGLALAVAGIGLFGLMAYNVARRTREIAIRMALGAESGGVLRSVLGECLAIVIVGVIVGLIVAVAAGRLMESLLFGLSPNDPLTIAGAILVMFAVAALAGYLPARRASTVDPVVALRHE